MTVKETVVPAFLFLLNPESAGLYPSTSRYTNAKAFSEKQKMQRSNEVGYEFTMLR